MSRKKKLSPSKEIALFVLEHGGGVYSNYDLDKLTDVIQKHLDYGTAVVIRNEKEGIIAVARWNFKGALVAEILDVIIHPKWRSPRMLKYMLLLGLNKHPQGRYIIFKRAGKYPDRKPRIYNIRKLLRRKG